MDQRPDRVPTPPKPWNGLDEDIARMRKLIFGGPELATGPAEVTVTGLETASKRGRLAAGELHSPGVVERKRGKLSAEAPAPCDDFPDRYTIVPEEDAVPMDEHFEDDEEERRRSSSLSPASVDLALDPPLSLSNLIRERGGGQTGPHQPHSVGLRTGCESTTTPLRSQHRHPVSSMSLQNRSPTPAGTMAFEFTPAEEAYGRMVERHRRWAQSRAPLHEAREALTDSPSCSPVLGECVVPSTTRWALLRSPSPHATSAHNCRAVSSVSLARQLREALNEESSTGVVDDHASSPFRRACGGRLSAPVASSVVPPTLRRTPSPPAPPQQQQQQEKADAPNKNIDFSALRAYFRRLGGGLRSTPPLPAPLLVHQ